MGMDEFKAEFQKKFKDKYEVKEKVGEGAFGVVFSGEDKIIKRDVAIKLFHKGSAPDGASRDWRIQTALKHSQISDTYTVELFDSAVLKKKCFAVISRFIVGEPFENYFVRITKSETSKRGFQITYMVRNLFESLLSTVNHCHISGFGHGDLHENNIIVSPGEKPFPVLVDFGNKSYGNNNFSVKESDNISNDLEQLRRMLKRLYGVTPWSSEIGNLLAVASSVSNVKTFLSHIVNFLGDPFDQDISRFSRDHIYKNVKVSLVRGIFGPAIADATKRFNHEISIRLGFEQLLEQTEQEYTEWFLKDPNSIVMGDATVIVQSRNEVDAIKDLLGEKSTKVDEN